MAIYLTSDVDSSNYLTINSFFMLLSDAHHQLACDNIDRGGN
ncbi:hypothetical protein PN499_02600 [Kamptonema animale CS-326]|nr:hypothetical protein [Kamptonema animale]MDB9510097.1 hypothetical protein [Kamptonema animale CS-326]